VFSLPRPTASDYDAGKEADEGQNHAIRHGLCGRRGRVIAIAAHLLELRPLSQCRGSEPSVTTYRPRPVAEHQ
jgi:hypothetical protein